ncbi:hypothetical protein [Phaeocystidibacter marisrubri]|uniref:Uncharacterized protein n=1 Tax=Phaeocystidibacter marisrubri TaxID=1577780 RepID=A0A6L3ZDM5_9FLAO|nr:hypothetical protein [Phaeocystidibacter marisrubri]KAB2815963.1 hypothetical protein F8C82_09710 [Phaeocystidibacter marisrubri]GGH66615.1 hypothetical protein GCM10011318_04770 [Phaeocystidibacter marisrubri]
MLQVSRFAMIRNLKFMWLLGLIFSSCTTQKIVISPLGPMDKPMPTLELTCDEDAKTDPFEFKDVLVVSKETITELAIFFDSTLATESKIDGGEHYPFGSYRVEVIKSEGSSSVYTLVGIEATLYFIEQHQLISTDSLYMASLNGIKRRLGG